MIEKQTINPTMIRLARESRGLTQPDLSKLVGIDQAKLSRLEKGFYLKFQPEVFEQLSIALQYPVAFFMQEGEIYPPTLSLYRKRSSLSSKEQNQYEATMNIIRLHIKSLLDSVDGLEVNIPICDIYDYGTPEEIANRVRVYWNLPKGPVSNITQLIETAGVFVFPLDADSNKFDGVSMMVDNRIPIIFYNSSLSGDRQRFTLAHELGHLVMHINGVPKAGRDVEEEANRFASEFLMPSTEIKNQLNTITLPILADMKLYWRVSMASLLKKARTLNNISDSQYRYLWQQMANYRKREPVDIPREVPCLIKHLINLHLDNLGYSREELAKLLNIFPKELDNYYMTRESPFRKISLSRH